MRFRATCTCKTEAATWLEVDVAGLKVGDTIRVKDLSLAKDKDVDIKDDPEAVVLTVVAVHNGAVPETETPEEAETEEAK